MGEKVYAFCWGARDIYWYLNYWAGYWWHAQPWFWLLFCAFKWQFHHSYTQKYSKCKNVKKVQLEPAFEQSKACVPFLQSFTADRNFCRSFQMFPSEMFPPKCFLSNFSSKCDTWINLCLLVKSHLRFQVWNFLFVSTIRLMNIGAGDDQSVSLPNMPGFNYQTNWGFPSWIQNILWFNIQLYKANYPQFKNKVF